MQNKAVFLFVALVLLLAGSVWIMERRHAGPEAVKPYQSAPATTLPPAQATASLSVEDGANLEVAITPVKKVIDGKTVSMLGYNGSIPGPTIRVKQGSTMTLNLKNEGDMPTTLHAHGVRMDNAFDGVPRMTQAEIKSGETFAYRLTFPDAGAFWYHPHVRTDYALESGLYGAIIVDPNETAYWPPTNRDIPLMLDDIALDRGGLLPFDRQTATHTLMGRFGNVMLTNGATDYQFTAKVGEVVRLYITNAANTRLFNFSIPGTKMKLVGADGGRYGQESLMENILLSPGERRVVDVFFEKTGSYPLLHATPAKRYALGQVTVTPEPASPSYAKEFSERRQLDSVREEMRNLLDTYGSREPDKKISIALDMNSAMRQGMPHGMHMMEDGMVMSDEGMGMGDDGEALEWEDTMSGMNAQSTGRMMEWKLVDDATGRANLDITDWKFKLGDKVKIRLFNDPRSMHPMQHPIHFHGQRFVVLATNGIVNQSPVWLDTTLVAKGDTVDILLEASNLGEWMAHCHILEHAESGMMLPFTVEER